MQSLPKKASLLFILLPHIPASIQRKNPSNIQNHPELSLYYKETNAAVGGTLWRATSPPTMSSLKCSPFLNSEAGCLNNGRADCCPAIQSPSMLFHTAMDSRRRNIEEDTTRVHLIPFIHIYRLLWGWMPWLLPSRSHRPNHPWCWCHAFCSIPTTALTRHLHPPTPQTTFHDSL